jgi:hypothetical protein
MRGLDFGGQTKIAYTQDSNLHALEVTDLDKRGRYATRRFFDGSKPEYPRAMLCIQGSDAHRLVRDARDPKHLGVGERVTEMLLKDVSFAALKEVLTSNDNSLVRPYRGSVSSLDFVQAAREEGPSLVQSFHASVAQRGGHLTRVLEDICALANTNGGAIYVGVSNNPKELPTGVRDPKRTIESLHAAIDRHLSPTPEVSIDSLTSQGQSVLRIVVQSGKETPYAIDDNRFYVRDEADTTLAVRDEIVRLVERSHGYVSHQPVEAATAVSIPEAPLPATPTSRETPPPAQAGLAPPRTGVEIVASEERQGTVYHTVKDLRNGNLIKNVTKSSARKLWHYAISQREAGLPRPEQIRWQGQIALLDERKKDGHTWYDLAMRDNGDVRIYYGVTDSGLNDDWLSLIET